ncbi:hypothetical protein KY290_018063 [Solanum tuberosum]|uniref:Retrotransposon Copia-like N-terminal domain-containing protein n=1 Tax=Solanum tuberosum TaxID=4113 RepID=A0ABQ7VD38_SOLTU|nr:hypothetical protein KY285_017028 [Solanum tuberosum]KAH0761990.1 hypothetical protein KY290_018063 [Solanum tuberosum]
MDTEEVIPTAIAPIVVGQTAMGSIFYFSNTLFLHASDAPGMNLVNSTFDVRDYQGWMRFVLIALSAKNKLGFIDSSCVEPLNTTPTFSSWHKCNDMESTMLTLSCFRMRIREKFILIHNSQMKLGNQMQKPGHPGQSSQRSGGQFQHSGGQPQGQRPSANPQRNFTPQNPRKVRRKKYNPNMFKQGQTTPGAGTSSEINANDVAGASEHMCYKHTSFLNLVSLPAPVTINLPNSYRIKVTHTDSIAIFPTLIL